MIFECHMNMVIPFETSESKEVGLVKYIGLSVLVVPILLWIKLFYILILMMKYLI